MDFWSVDFTHSLYQYAEKTLDEKDLKLYQKYSF